MPNTIWQFVFLVLLLMCSVFFFYHYYGTTNTPNRPQSVLSPQNELSSDAYRQVEKLLVSQLEEQDPGSALEQLQAWSATDSAVLRSCHPLAHELGRAAYIRYGSFGEAIQYQEEVCNSGYLHGVIEQHFRDVTDVSSEMTSLCAEFPVGKIRSWQCYHGVGHGLMYALDNDLPHAVSLCQTYPETIAKSACINGVFMENFNTDQKIHPSKFLSIDDAFFPCAVQPADVKADCYFYAPTYYLHLHPNAYTQALDWCRQAPAADQAVCAAGVGSQMMKEHLDATQLVEQMCDQYPPFRDSCLSGMTSFLLFQSGSLDKVSRLCTTMASSHRQVCEQTVQSQKALFAP